MTYNKVNFVGGTQPLYNAIEHKDPNSLYFISDTQRIYKGDVDVTQNVIPVTVFPKEGVLKKIYVHRNTLETRIFDEGKWKVIIPGFVSTLDEVNDDNNKDRLATLDAFKAYVDQVLTAKTANLFNSVSFNPEDGKLKMRGEGEDSIKFAQLKGVAHDATYDATNLQIRIPQYGKDDLVVDLPHDNFLSDAYYDAEYSFEEDGNVGPAIVLVVKTDNTPDGEEKKIAIPAASMVNDYTAGKTNNIKVTINDNHKIKAQIIIDSETEDGTLMIWDSENQKIGTQGVKVTRSNDGENELPEDEAADNYVPTAAVVAAAIKKACAEITDHMLTFGAKDEVVISTENGIIRSGFYIGGETLSWGSDNAAHILATEAAVMDALSWKALA